MPQPQNQNRDNELGALWKKESKNGVIYMTGTISGVQVVCFHNDNKNEEDPDDRQPDWRVLKSTPRAQR